MAGARPPRGDDRSVRVWDIATGQGDPRPQGPHRRRLDVAFSPDGKTIGLREPRPDRQALGCRHRPGDQNPRRGISAGVNAVAFSPDGKTLASAGKDDGFVLFWDVDSGRQLRVIKARPAAGQRDAP